MDVVAIALISILLTIVLLILKKFGRTKEFRDAFDKLPGPKGLPIIRHTLDIARLDSDELASYNYENAKKYGPIVKSWVLHLPTVNLSSPEACEVILSGMKYLEKNFVYDMLSEWLGEGLLTSKGLKWQKHRKLITPTFHFKILENFIGVMEEKSHILVECLKQASASGKSFNIFPLINNATLDIICETAMGTNINAQLDSQGHYVSAILSLSDLAMKRLFRPWLLSDFIYKLTSAGRQWGKQLNVLHGFTNKVIKERKEAKKNAVEITQDLDSDIGKKKRVAFLDLLLEFTSKDPTFTDKDIRDEVDTFMFEGHDTTTNGIAFTIYLLGRHPEVQERVYEEIQEVFGEDDRPFTTNDLSQMKYLERVIKESLRLYPPVPAFGRKLEEDATFNGVTVPSGAFVMIHPYTLHRNPESFPNPLQFNPDNFLPENIKDRHPYAYIPFSAGPRNCIGQKFALNEEKIVLTTILKNFKITSIDKEEDIKVVVELVLRTKYGINVILEPRTKSQ